MKKIIEKFSALTVTQKLLIFFVVALILRFASYSTNPYIHKDSILYLSINYHDSNGELQKGLEMHRQLPPAILYYMRVFSTLGVDVEVGYRITGVFLYSLVLFSFYYIAKRFLSEKASLFATFAYIVHPRSIEYSHAVLRETLAFPFLFFGLALFILSYDRKSKVFAFMSGVCFSVSYMSRLEYGVALFMAFTLIVIFQLIKKIKMKDGTKGFWISSIITICSMAPLLLLADIDMKRHNSYWDPFSYRKVKGFVERTFR